MNDEQKSQISALIAAGLIVVAGFLTYRNFTKEDYGSYEPRQPREITARESTVVDVSAGSIGGSVVKFRDGDVACYVLLGSYRGGISCLRDSE